MILKLLLVIAVIWIVYTMFVKKKPLKQNKSSTNNNEDADDMVLCDNCSVYSELKDSILSNGKFYCSQECLDEAKQ